MSNNRKEYFKKYRQEHQKELREYMREYRNRPNYAEKYNDYQKARNRGTIRAKRMWNTKEEIFIIENYAKMTDMELAKELNRSIDSVNQKIFRLKQQNRITHSKRKVEE